MSEDNQPKPGGRRPGAGRKKGVKTSNTVKTQYRVPIEIDALIKERGGGKYLARLVAADVSQ